VPVLSENFTRRRTEPLLQYDKLLSKLFSHNAWFKKARSGHAGPYRGGGSSPFALNTGTAAGLDRNLIKAAPAAGRRLFGRRAKRGGLHDVVLQRLGERAHQFNSGCRQDIADQNDPELGLAFGHSRRGHGAGRLKLQLVFNCRRNAETFEQLRQVDAGRALFV
jgi:hypothetical protein